MRHRDPIIKQMYRRKLEQTITSYEAQNLNDIDKKLLKGLYEKKVYDVEDGKDKMIMSIKKFILSKVRKEKGIGSSEFY